MFVKGFQKEYFEVELDSQELRNVWNAYPATSMDLLNRLQQKFTQEVQKADKAYDLHYNAEYGTWLTDGETMETVLHRHATPTEIDFFETIQTLKNILLSKEISK